MSLRCACGSPRWIACCPGSEAEARDQGNLCLIRPAPEVAQHVWCKRCWPFAKQSAA